MRKVLKERQEQVTCLDERKELRTKGTDVQSAEAVGKCSFAWMTRSPGWLEGGWGRGW